MDQVKKALAIAKEQHFWIVSGLAVLMVLGTWFSVTSSLQSEEDAKRKEIEGKFGQANTVKGKQNHVNDTTHSQMDILVEQKSIDVARAWKAQYEDQKNILIWPEELEEDFIGQVNRFRPIETFPFPPETTQEILIRFRERYRDYIKSELPKLAEIIRADWAASDTGGSGDGSGAPGGMGGMSGMGMSGMGMSGMGMSGAGMGGGSSGMGGMPGGFGGTSGSGGKPGNRKSKAIVVDWAADDQTRLQNTRFDWRGQANKAPNTLQVLYAQEDLWVLQEIMRIIRKTNGDVEERERAAIKKIDFIRIGVNAGGQAGSVTRPQGNTGMGAMGSMAGSSGGSSGGGAAAGAAMTAAMSGMSGMSGGSSGGGSGSPSGTGATSGEPDPGDNRYVDNNLQPIAASKIRSALKSTAKSSDEAFFVVAKRMPVRMRVTMDQRQVNRLLAECGNANLPIEIRQVRINRDASSLGGGGGGSGGMGMGGGMSGGMPSMGGGMGGGMAGMGGGAMSGGMGMGGMGMGGSSGEGSSGMGSGMAGMGGMDGSGGGIGGRSFDSSPFDVPVEFLGIVYIYNPVDIGKLGLDPSKAGSLNEGSTTPAAPTNPATAEGNVNPAATKAGG